MNSLICRDFFALIRSEKDLVLDPEKLVIYRVITQLLQLQNRFMTNNLYFAFDHKSIRYDIFPNYKKRRKTLNKPRKGDTVDFTMKRKELLVEVTKKIRRIVLKRILGFKNVYRKYGYESDDIVASLCVDNKLPVKDLKIVVTGDKDLYQLIGKNNTMVFDLKKKKLINKQDFIKMYGIKPDYWNIVKAMCGDDSDDIPGIEGIGESRAIAFVKNNLHPNFVEKIQGQQKLIDSNLKLVTLPMNHQSLDYTFIKRKKDTTSIDKWRLFCDRFGIRTLLNTPLKGNNKNG